MTRAIKLLMLIGAIIAALIGVFMIHGCATTKGATAVVKSCAPTSAQVDAIVGVLSTNIDQDKAVAEAEGLGFLACILHNGAQEIVNAITPPADAGATATEAAGYSPLLPNAMALLKKYP